MTLIKLFNVFISWSGFPRGAILFHNKIFIFPVDGGYTEWSLWSSCTKTCGGGRQMRTRNCTSPLPIDGGLDCADLGIGGDEESKQCNAMVCPGQIGMW